MSKALYMVALVLRAIGGLLWTALVHIVGVLLLGAAVLTALFLCIDWIYKSPATQIALLVLIGLAAVGACLLVLICRCNELWDQDRGARRD